jgi:chromosome segregation ATPase
MGRKQIPKGYRRRQHDRQRERWKHFLRKEKRKIEKREGVVIKMPLDHEVTTLAEELRDAQHEVAVYKKAWESEKQTAEAWRKNNAVLRKQVKDLRLKLTVMCGAYIVLAVIAIVRGLAG